MSNYHIVCSNEKDKYCIIDLIRAAGATLTGVSGYGSGYYIQLDATPEQLREIDTGLEELNV